MKNIVAALQMNSSADVNENLHQAKKLIADAVTQGAKLLVLPEMFAIIGKIDTDKINVAEQEGSGLIQDFLSQQAIQHQVWIVSGTIPLVTDDPTKVAAACLVYNAQGQVVARYDKIHMFDVNVGDQNYLESKTSKAGNKVVVADTPFGKLGVCVCYDIRFPELARALVDQGTEIIAVPTAFTQRTGVAHWDILIRALAIQTQCYVIAACETGQHPNGRSTYGHSVIVDPWGSVLAILENNAGVISATLDLKFVEAVRKNMPLKQQRRL